MPVFNLQFFYGKKYDSMWIFNVEKIFGCL